MCAVGLDGEATRSQWAHVHINGILVCEALGQWEYGACVEQA